MKKLFLLLFSMLISLNSYGANWINIASTNEHDFYADINSIKKNNEFVYAWILTDAMKPSSYGDLSNKILYETKCNNPYKYRGISWHYYKLPMGQGSPDSNSLVGDWNYASPESAREEILNFICNR